MRETDVDLASLVYRLSAACCLVGSGATHSSANFITLEMLSSTSYGVMSPITTTFFFSKSTSNDVTPAHKDGRNCVINT